MPTEETSNRPSLNAAGTRIVLACLLIGAATLSPTPARAQGDPQHPRPARTVEDVQVPALPGMSVELPQAEGPVPEGISSDGGLLVYQSYQDGNWEIYASATDRYSVGVRLTADPASDLEPDLSPSMAQVAFTSRRTGNYEIFRMNRDGGAVVQLTNHSAIDSSPAWSPDSQRIAFQSNRNGNYDVFVMNADGSGLAQLTTNGDYDGEPTWSPDGSRLAYISKRSTGDTDYFLYVMNADGSGQHLLSPVPYSSRPAWSHDGKRILIDGANSSGWQRLFTVDAISGATTEKQFSSNQPYVDVLSGTWGTGGTIYATYIQYVSVNGQWYWEMMFVQAGHVDDWYMETLQGNRAGYPSWSGSDIWPPETQLVWPASPYVRYGQSLIVRAVQLDRGIGGQGWTEFQARGDSYQWQYMGRCTNETAISARCFPWTSGSNTVDIRARSTDGFGNVEEWPEDPARWIRLTLYWRENLGRVLDTGGAELALLPVVGIPARESNPLTNADGQWLAHETGWNAPYTVSVTVEGTTVAQPVSYEGSPGNQDPVTTLVVPPAENVLVNPDFESPALAWAPQTSAAVRALTTVEMGIPSNGMRLGWSVAGVGVLDTGRSTTAVVSGTTTLIARRKAGSNQLMLCPPTGECVTEDLGPTETRDLALRDDGTLAMVRNNGDGTRSFLQRSPTGVWSQPEDLPFLGTGLGHRLLVDSTGRWHYVWAEGDGMVHVTHRVDDGSWTGASQAGLMQKGFDAVIDSADVIHMVGCPTTGVVEVTWSDVDGMSLPATISGETCDTPFFGISQDSGAHIDAVWSVGNVARFSRRASNGSWGTVVPAAGVTIQALFSGLGPQGRAALLVSNAAEGLFLLQSAADGASWEHVNPAIPPLGPATARALLAFNWNGQSKMVLRETFATPDADNLRIVQYDFNPDRSHAVATQRAILPPGINRPRLSLEYRFTTSDSSDTLRLAIQGAGEGAPTYFDLPAGPDWQRRAFDVSAWAGQTITVILQLTDGGAATTPFADFNEIYLGASYTPVVTGLTPAQLPGTAGTFVVAGDNFISPRVRVGQVEAAVTVLDAHHLQVTVPVGVALGRQTVYVTNRDSWTVAAPEPLRLGSGLVFLPHLMRWSPPAQP